MRLSLKLDFDQHKDAGNIHMQVKLSGRIDDIDILLIGGPINWVTQHNAVPCYESHPFHPSIFLIPPDVSFPLATEVHFA